MSKKGEMEKLFYIDINNKSHFVHEHIPDEIKGSPCIFINPLFDEKKRSQKFYAETAREFCKSGIPVIRFDYYGTGDSEGQLYELNLPEQLTSVKSIIDKTLREFQTNKIILFGLRFGADLVLELSTQYPVCINQLILIEPIINGKRYLTEQRSRRKIFHRLNKMTEIPDNIIIDGSTFEDHQGYPISKDNLSYINNLDALRITLSNTNILLVKLNAISSRKYIIQLKKNLEMRNNVQNLQFNCDNFWANLEPTDTFKLSQEIVNRATSFQLHVTR